jgi:hypothetical protein
MKLQFWWTELNKEEDEQSSPGRRIHLSPSVEQCHPVQALSHIGGYNDWLVKMFDLYRLF